MSGKKIIGRITKVSVTGPRGVNCGLSTDTGVGPAMIDSGKKGGPKI